MPYSQDIDLLIYLNNEGEYIYSLCYSNT